MAHAANGIRLMRHGDLVDKLQHFAQAQACIFAHLHRRRAGMCFFAGQCYLQPPQPLAMSDDANVLVLNLKDRALFDMQLKHRMDFALADRLIALPANTLQLIDEFLAFGVRAFIGPILLMHTGENAGSKHCRRKTRAFFIGPVDHDDRALCLDIGVVQCAHDFKSAKHTEHAVIFAACRLRVEMAAHIDRISIRIFAGAKEEHIAHRVDGHRQSGFFTP